VGLYYGSWFNIGALIVDDVTNDDLNNSFNNLLSTWSISDTILIPWSYNSYIAST